MPRKTKKPPKALLKRAKRYHVKVTRKVGSKRVYKSVALIKKLIKKAIKKVKKTKRVKRTKRTVRRKRSNRFGIRIDSPSTIPDNELEGRRERASTYINELMELIRNKEQELERLSTNYNPEHSEYDDGPKRAEKIRSIIEKSKIQLKEARARVAYLNNLINNRNKFGGAYEDALAEKEKANAVRNKLEYAKKREEDLAYKISKCPWTIKLFGKLRGETCDGWARKLQLKEDSISARSTRTYGDVY
jgi:chromosome segregation ATPase